MNRRKFSLFISAFLLLSIETGVALAAGDVEQTIVVKGSFDETRDATATKTVIRRDDIDRYGDTRLVDILQKQPGISVNVNGAGGAEIRIRGLGSGYVQILVDGEPVSANFSIESISPHMIERIEVLKVGQVDSSMKGIAGTINIILRRASTSVVRELKLNSSNDGHRPSNSLYIQYGDRVQALTYSLGGTLGVERKLGLSAIEQKVLDTNGQALNIYNIQRSYDTNTASGSFSPSFSLKLGGGNTVSMENLFRIQRYKESVNDSYAELAISPDEISRDSLGADYLSKFWQSRVSGMMEFPDGQKFEANITGLYGSRKSNATILNFGPSDVQIQERLIASSATDVGMRTSGKLRTPYLETHTLAAGWEIQYSGRNEARVENSKSGAESIPVIDDESYTAQIRQLALFAQDEWDLSANLSWYMGARWEVLETRSEGDSFEPVTNKSSVLSPVLQSLWRLGDGDQVRLGLSRSYKAPTTREVIPRRWVVPNNTPTTPNYQGNPNLRPELAWGADISFEHYFQKAGSLSSNAYLKKISDVVLEDVSFVDNTWILQPKNRGAAVVYGVEVEGKLDFRKLNEQRLPFVVRASVARGWSSVDSISGPGNRLDRQQPYGYKVGADYYSEVLPVSAGANISVAGGGLAKASSTLSSTSPAEHQYDAYALWMFKGGTQLRLSLSRKVPQHGNPTIDTYRDDNGTFQQSTFVRAATIVRVGVELKL